MRLQDVLQLPTLARIRVVAGRKGLAREVRWVHVVDIPDVRSWVRPGQLLLTTGYAWPREDDAQRLLIQDLYNADLAGVGMAVPQFFEHFPRAAVEQAEELGFPLLEIPWEIPFATISETISRAILAEQSAILEHSEAIHRSLTRAALELDDLGSMLRRIAFTLGRRCHYYDVDGRRMASEYPDRSSSSSDQTQGTDTLETFGDPGTLNAILGAHCPVQVTAGGETWLAGPVRLGQRLLGFIALVNDGRPFTDLDLRAVEHAATVVALHFSYQQRVDLVQKRLRYGLIDSLIEGRWEATPAALERARLLGFDPNARYTVCIFLLRREAVPLEGEEAFMRREWVAEEIRRYLERLGSVALLTVSLNRVVVLLPAEADPLEVWRLFDPDEVAVGVAEPSFGVDDIPQGFRQAEKALEWSDNTGFCHYGDTLLPRIFEGSGAVGAAFAKRTLGPLLDRSPRLLETLCALARHDFSLKHTSRHLHVHPNTLRYRLRQIERRLGVDLANPETRFQIRLAVEILDVRHKMKDANS